MEPVAEIHLIPKPFTRLQYKLLCRVAQLFEQLSLAEAEPAIQGPGRGAHFILFPEGCDGDRSGRIQAVQGLLEQSGSDPLAAVIRVHRQAADHIVFHRKQQTAPKDKET